ncbi:hypothetical protein BZA77DRAFT_298117 [Pyronema omphalodes]|nr:hypothetical protein BZA77DRAFT_298117 [Pyronema omphalodes]
MAQAPSNQNLRRSNSRNSPRPTNASSSSSTTDMHHISPQLSAVLSISSPNAEFEAMQQELFSLTVRRQEIRDRIAFLEGMRLKSPDSSHDEYGSDGSQPVENHGEVAEDPGNSHTPPVSKALGRVRAYLQHLKAEEPQFIQDLKDSQERNEPLEGLSARKYDDFIQQLTGYCQELVEEKLDQFRAENSGVDDEFMEDLRMKFYELVIVIEVKNRAPIFKIFDKYVNGDFSRSYTTATFVDVQSI